VSVPLRARACPRNRTLGGRFRKGGGAPPPSYSWPGPDEARIVTVASTVGPREPVVAIRPPRRAGGRQARGHRVLDVVDPGLGAGLTALDPFELAVEDAAADPRPPLSPILAEFDRHGASREVARDESGDSTEHASALP